MSDQIEQETAVVNASSEELLKQAEEAKAREVQEAEEKKQAELKACREYGLTLSEDERDTLRDYIDAVKDATSKFEDAEYAYNELESAWEDKAYEYNEACVNYNDALQDLETQKDNIEHILEKFIATLEGETSDKIIPDPLRRLLVNACESFDTPFDFCRCQDVDTYLDIESPDSELCDAENLGIHLEDLEKLLPEETLNQEAMDEVKAWSNNYTIFQLHTEIQTYEKSFLKQVLRYGLDIYNTDSTWDVIYKELCAEYGVTTND